MTDEERKALVETVRLEAELNANYDKTVFRMLHRIGHALEEDGQRIEELESWKAAEEAHHHLLKRRIAELEATIKEITGS